MKEKYSKIKFYSKKKNSFHCLIVMSYAYLDILWIDFFGYRAVFYNEISAVERFSKRLFLFFLFEQNFIRSFKQINGYLMNFSWKTFCHNFSQLFPGINKILSTEQC